jgi:hypothetical protein
MPRQVRSSVIVALLCSVFATAAHATDFATGLSVGYKGGFGLKGSAGIYNFAQGFPLGVELGLGYARMDPGDPFPVRRIFIANATNGTPEKSGMAWDLRLDFMYNLRLNGPKAFYLFAGPRLSMFTGTFRYVGANEEFDVTSNKWGVGIGAKGVFAISSRVDLTLTGGFDQYFDGSLHGHDTTYNPDNVNVNAKENFTYKDAAAVVYAPRFQPSLLLGLGYNF